MSQNACFIIDATKISTNISMLGQLVVVSGRFRGENGYHFKAATIKIFPLES
jgi:hypothetical protein